MATEGLNLGTVNGKVTRWAGVKALFNLRLPANRATRRFFASCKRKQPNPTVRLTNAVHTAVFAPTGVGKGVSVVIPHLLECRDSMCVVDFKAENYKITADARRRMGQRVVCLDPFGVVGGMDTFNPIGHMDSEDRNAFDACRSVANAIVMRTGMEHDQHWNDTSENLISTAIGFVVCFAAPEDKNLQTVRTLITDSQKFQKMIEACCVATEWGGMLARAGHQLAQLKDKELASVLSTVHRHMRFLDTMAVAASTKQSSFDPSQLVNGKMTVYLVIPPDLMRSNSALLRMWISSLLKAVVQGGLQERRKVQFLLDESASLGHLDCIDDAVDKLRGYGVRLLFLFQSLGQVKKCFPDGQEQTLLSNVTQVFFGVNDQQTAEYVSNRLGEETIIVASGGTSTSKSQQASQNGQGGNASYSTSTSSNWQQNARKLLKPEEVTALDPRVAITLTPGCPPICSWLPRYYEPDFMKPCRIGFFRAAFDALCLFSTVAILAVLTTMAVADILK